MKRIALIDDNQTNLTLLWHLIRKIKGYEAANFLDPNDALAWCEDNEVELIIVNAVMEKMSGLVFLDQFRQISARKVIPVIMLVGSEQADIRHQALEKGVTDFLTLPLDKTEFTVRLINILSLRDCQKKLDDQTTWLNAEVSKATKDLLNREQEIIYRLTKAAEYRDPETGGHIKRMAHYSQYIAKQLGFSSAEQNLLLQAAPMHDIGKVGIPDAILLKPGKLDQSEFEIMKEHPQYGYDILSGSESKLMQLGAEIALSHHEKYDGSGYPNGLKDEEISIYGRIVAVADVFDALTSERPYKKPWSIDDAIGFLRNHSGTHFDRACVYAFLLDMDEVLSIKERFKDIE